MRTLHTPLSSFLVFLNVSEPQPRRLGSEIKNKKSTAAAAGAATSTSPGYSAAARARKTARRRALTCTASLSINNMLRPEGQRFYFTSSLVVLAPRRTMYTWPAWGSATRMPCRLKYSAASLPSTVTSSMPVVGMSVSVLL